MVYTALAADVNPVVNLGLANFNNNIVELQDANRVANSTSCISPDYRILAIGV